MTETMIGLFRFRTEADIAVRDLGRMGFPDSAIRVIGPGCPAAGPLAAGLIRMGFERRTSEFFAESVRRGSVLVGVKTEGRRLGQAAGVLERRNASTIRRAPVSRAAANPAKPFEPGTVELTETAHRAVVSKAPRVVEEIVVHKDVTEREHTVRDDVKRTHVEIERDGPES